MCGLCGVLSTNISDNEFENFAKIFNVSSLRGEHSSGLFSVKEIETKDKKKLIYSARYLKGVGSSGYFTEVNWKNIKENIHDSSDTILVAGHCRHATRGSITAANAHPFNFSNIIGMHNGTLTDNIGPKVPKNKNKKSKADDTETDSESFYRYLNDHTLEETLGELNEYGDAYAFVWYDKVKRTINFLRNHKRPLWFAKVNESTLYWASEKEFLMFILNRNYTGYSNNIQKLSEIPVDTLITFDVTAVNPVQACTLRKIENIKYKRNKFVYEGYQGPRRGPHGGYAGFGGDSWDESEMYERAYNSRDKSDAIPFAENSGSSVATTLEERKKLWAEASNKMKKNEGPTSNVITLPNVRTSDKPIEYTINNKDYTRDQYERLLEKGCAWCSVQADLAEKVQWFGSEDYLCEACASDEEIKAYLKT